VTHEKSEGAKQAWDVGADWAHDSGYQGSWGATPPPPATKDRTPDSLTAWVSTMAICCTILSLGACLDPSPAPRPAALMPLPVAPAEYRPTYWQPDTGANGGRRPMHPALLESQARARAAAR
jgi:hypothetical protein